jgi:hypothetical protein
MKNSNVILRRLLSVGLILSTLTGGFSTVAQQQQRAAATTFERAQSVGSSATNANASAAATTQVLERNVRAHMEFLASDAMQGRGSGTQFELLAGHYIASQLRQYGVEPAGDAGATAGQKSFIQTVTLTRQAFAEAPALNFNAAGGAQRRLVHGREMLVGRVASAQVSGALQKLRAGERPTAGAVVLLMPDAGGSSGSGDVRQLFAQASALGQAGAVAVIVAENDTLRRNWTTAGARLPELPLMAGRGASTILVLSTDAFKELQGLADGTQINFGGTLAPAQTSYTWNVVGVLPGSDAKLSGEAVLLSAHMDHIGVGTGQTGDQIYNGADDDASGVVAVLELARALAAAGGARPKRTTYFVLFGSEEKGGHGAQYFLSNPPVPLTQMVANRRESGRRHALAHRLRAFQSRRGTRTSRRATRRRPAPRTELLPTLRQLRPCTSRRRRTHGLQLRPPPRIPPTRRRHRPHRLRPHDPRHQLDGRPRLLARQLKLHPHLGGRQEAVETQA